MTRWWITIIACSAFVASAPAQPARAASIDGVYNGSYAGGQAAPVRGQVGQVANAGVEPTKFKLSITQGDNGVLTGVFTLYLPEGSDMKEYTCALTGFIQANRTFLLNRAKWEIPPPKGFEMAAGMNGQFDPGGGNGAGQVAGKMRDGSRPKFEAIRDAAESAKMAPVIANKQDDAKPASNPGRAAAKTAAAPDASGPTVINGVYNGTYTGKQGPIRFKLTLWTQQENNSNPAGVLTFYLSEGSGTNAYTCELTGFFIPAHGTQPDRIQLSRTKWETQPPRDLLFEGGMQGVFDRDGGNGAGQFSGYMSDASSSKFQSLRDAAESAKVASARLPNKLRPSIEGVFNGTYTRENEPPTKFKLTMTYPSGDVGGGSANLAGIATIYLPIDSGTKAYTYSLKGAEDGYGNFELKVYDWETIPPKDFRDFKAMGFNGRFVPDRNRNTARIIGAQPDVTFFVPKFEATWDATESADIKSAIAVQMAVDSVDQAAALKAHAEVMKNAQPKQLASKYLVRKSKAYWDGYRSDFIREVFDGGFADDVDNDPAFQSLFTDYVDLFSKNCAAYLPTDSKSITITTVTTTTYPGGAVTTSTTSKTVEVDSRFIPKYVEYSGVDPAPGSDQEKEQTARTIAIAGQIFHAGGPSHGVGPADAIALLHLEAAHGLFGGVEMEKFFATEVKATGPSAALRQMGENLLRGATGEPSLQEAGAKIDGAGAETDKDLPPGRFARLIDAANTFYRDPANARLKSRFETAFDETLAAKYQGVMTRDEEYYYANDFENRFRGQIMQPRAYCKDPEWPRLHPAVEECIEELQ
jgi:hypothetical protein